MKYIHAHCKGEIDVRKKRCLGCSKKWNLISFWLDSSGIRPVVEKEDIRLAMERRAQKEESATLSRLIQERVPGSRIMVKLLPNWPRWARILSAAV